MKKTKYEIILDTIDKCGEEIKFKARDKKEAAEIAEALTDFGIRMFEAGQRYKEQ